MRVTRVMLGTAVEIAAEGPQADLAIRAAFDEIGRVERLLSRFLPESEVAAINRSGDAPVAVSPETFRVLSQGLRVGTLSGGAFDITAGSPGCEGGRDVSLAGPPYRVCLTRPGAAVDLGGIAKGYAVDRAIGVLRELGMRRAAVNAGGDLRVLGSWTVGIEHPWDPGELLCRFRLTDAAVATSGNYGRQRPQGGRPRARAVAVPVLDPRRRGAATGARSATVVAGQAWVADALATAVCVLGPQAGIALLRPLAGTRGLAVGQAGEVVFSPGWPAAGDRCPIGYAECLSQGSHGRATASGQLGALALIVACLTSCVGGQAVAPPLNGPAATAQVVSPALVDGVYAGESLSGVLVRVQLTVNDGHIGAIEIVEYREVSSIQAGLPTDTGGTAWSAKRDEVLREIPRRILQAQTATVEAVTGATLSSQTIMAAVEAALIQAGSTGPQ